MKLTLVHIDQIPVEWPFFKTNFEFKVNDAFSDTNCDSVTLDVTIDNENYLQVNVYRPNEENPQFYKDIRKKLKQFQITTILLWMMTTILLWIKTSIL